MLSSKDYSNMTLEELMAETKKLKSGTIASAFVIGMLVGVAVLLATNGKFLITISLLGVALFIGYKNSQNKKALQAEISRKETAQ